MNREEQKLRRQSALSRVRTHLADAEYYEQQATAEHAKAATLIRTWDLCPVKDESHGFCCQDPENCRGRQP